MIKTIAELLQSFIKEEQRKLDTFNIRHAPTIGAMYEGLTKDFLNKAIPSKLSLKLVEGFITDGKDSCSGQIDCMLVNGEGEKIPYTNQYKYHIKNVIAVLEVKKGLNKDGLEDSFFHLREVNEIYSRYIQNDEGEDKYDITPVNKIFSQITGLVAPTYKNVDSLSFDLETIYRTLLTELLSPVRIVIGYNAWKKEQTLRNNVFKFIRDRESKVGLGVGSFPQLIIAGEFSLVKVNGFPYTASLDDGRWPFLVSTRANPIRLMLELIWTRLDHLYEIDGFWGEDLTEESMSPFISGKAIKKDDVIGWDFKFENLSETVLESKGTDTNWSPVKLTKKQHDIIVRLCNGEKIYITDNDFIKSVGGDNFVEDFVIKLSLTMLVAVAGKQLVLVTDKCQCAFDPDSGFVAAENNTGRFTRWLEKRIGKKMEDAKVLRVNIDI